jgi:hypothetical protein
VLDLREELREQLAERRQHEGGVALRDAPQHAHRARAHGERAVGEGHEEEL